MLRDIDRQTGMFQADLSGVQPKDIPSGKSLLMVQEMKYIKIRPIAEKMFRVVAQAATKILYGFNHHIVDGPRKFSAIVTEEESKVLEQFMSKFTDGSSILDKFDPHEYRDIRWDVRADVVSTSVTDKEANIQSMMSFAQLMRMMTPPFHSLIPHFAAAYDFPNIDKIKVELKSIVAKIDEQIQGQGGGLTPEVLSSFAAKLEADGVPEEVVKKVLDTLIVIAQTGGGPGGGGATEGGAAPEGVSAFPAAPGTSGPELVAPAGVAV